ncbi:hypothetical protein [Serinibacter salmoneus]|nr:hypothetical protein [Serinibacter salmoneus]
MSDVEDLGHTARVHLKLASDDRMPLDALLVRGLVEDTLIVSLHGYTDRKKYIPPRFERLASLSTLERHGLYLADPTIRLSPKLSLGWYVGDETYDPTPDLADLINSIARHLEVERVLLTGSSGGGFASMALAPRVENATALVFSPQTRIRRYRPYLVKRFHATAFPSYSSWQEIEEQHRARVDLCWAYAHGPGADVVYVQNTGDEFHMSEHCEPFLEVAGDRVRVHYEHHVDGHGPPRVARVLEWVESVVKGTPVPPP